MLWRKNLTSNWKSWSEWIKKSTN